MRVMLFQALFCWIDGGEPCIGDSVYPCRRQRRSLPRDVSSLVLLDRWGGTVGTGRKIGYTSEFQALFCWIDGGEQ